MTKHEKQWNRLDEMVSRLADEKKIMRFTAKTQFEWELLQEELDDGKGSLEELSEWEDEVLEDAIIEICEDKGWLA